MEWTSIKDYAAKHGITIQAVYQQINRKKNKDFIEQHINEINGIKYLDDAAVKYLEERRQNTPAVVVSENKDERIEELENKLQQAQQMIIELQKKVIESRDREFDSIEKLKDSLQLYNLALVDKAALAEEVKNTSEKLGKAEVEILEKMAANHQLEQKLAETQELVVEKESEIKSITNENKELLARQSKLMARGLWDRIRNKEIN